MMLDLKIRNATREQWAVAGDIARANIGIVDRRGIRNGVVLLRGDVSVYLYLTESGKSAVAYVNYMPPHQPAISP